MAWPKLSLVGEETKTKAAVPLLRELELGLSLRARPFRLWATHYQAMGICHFCPFLLWGPPVCSSSLDTSPGLGHTWERTDTSCPHRGYVLMREEGMNKE